MADSVSASPRSASLGAVADALMRLKRRLGTETSIPDPRMDPHLGALRPQTPTVPLGALFGQGPEEIDRWSYGNSPLKTRFPGVSGRLPELQDSRKGPVLDAVALLPLGTVAKGVSGAAPIGALFGAMKPKGGMWLPRTVEKLTATINRPVGAQPVHVGDVREEEFARMVRNWLNRYAGTSEDPLKDIPIPHEWREGMRGEDVINELVPLERLTDKAFKEADPRTILSDPKAFGVENARQGDRFYYAVSGPETGSFLDYLGHVGDTLSNVPTPDLKRWDLIRAVRETARADAAARAALSKNQEARQAAAVKINAELPPYKTTVEGGPTWYEFKRGMDPEQVALGLSVDTCLGGHCVAGVGHNAYGYLGYVPQRDLVTRKKVHPNLPDVSSYTRSVLSGETRIYSLRGPKGEVYATIEAKVPNLNALQFQEADPHNPVFTRFPEPSNMILGNSVPSGQYQSMLAAWSEKIASTPEFKAWARQQPLAIEQIKGPLNEAVPREAWPYVQEFVRGNKWTEVLDAENAGLYSVRGGEFGDAGVLLTEQELREALRKYSVYRESTLNSWNASELRMRLEALQQGRREE